jgi:hypothetical protein
VTEKNAIWRPILDLTTPPNPIKRAVVLIWRYEDQPPRISQRYSLVLAEPLPSPRAP